MAPTVSVSWASCWGAKRRSLVTAEASALRRRVSYVDGGKINCVLRKALSHNLCVQVQAMHEFGASPLFAFRGVVYLIAQ